MYVCTDCRRGSARAERADRSLVYSYDHLGTVSGLIWDMLLDCRCNYILICGEMGRRKGEM
jgi:hypothetical protein